MVARDRQKALALLKQHGAAATSFQAVEPGLEYWFDDDLQACVAYVDTGAAWVAVGGPIAPEHHTREAIERFVAQARAHRRRVRLFAIEPDAMAGANLATIHIGEQPSWDPHAWPEVVRSKRSLREQLRRARAKRVTVRRVHDDELSDPTSAARRGIDRLVARWKDTRAMAPMGFMVQLDLYSFPDERRCFVAERDGEVVGLLSAVPVYARNGWFFEDVLRQPDAPNGTIELLFDQAMRAAHAEGSRFVTFGLAPLAGAPSRVLSWIRDHTKFLYDFNGLLSFKAKLKPAEWRPVYLAFPDRTRKIRAVIDSLTAFAHGSLIQFGLATLRHRAAAVTRVLALLLIPWTLAMAVTDTTRWFPSLAVKLGWIGLDIVLFGLLLSLAARWRRRLAAGLSGLAFCDFALGCTQAALYNARAGPEPWLLDWIVIALALLAPLFASVFLWVCRDRATLYATPADPGGLNLDKLPG